MANFSNTPQRNRPERPPITPEAKRRVFTLVANSFLFILVYYGAMGINQPIIATVVTFAYWIAFAGFLIAYIIYNRAFTRKKITEEMLPDTMTKAEKEEFIADGKARLEKSKWMLSIIIPLLVTIAIDAIYLFTWPMVQQLFKIS